MVATGRACDRNRLSHLLADELSAAERNDTENHLETCATCREELESLAGKHDEWRDLSRFLRTDASDPAVPLSGPGARLADEFADGVTYAGVDAVLRLLAPSENPAMLGRVGDYDVLEVIGSGGMGIVLKGYDRDLNRFVAIKILWPHFATNAAARKRFAREARAAAAVVHPHVVSIHRVADDGAAPFIAMQYVPGQSLQQRIDAGAPLELKEILRIGMQAAKGLSAAHAQGLVHRDVKPGNILLENGVERVLLSDFGLARAADDASMTQSGVIAGTPQFMSPEQARGSPLDSRSDLFSLGSVIYAMCTGHSPFRAETAVGALGRIYHEAPRALRQVNPDVPRWLAGIVDRLLEKEPAKRFQSAEEVADLLGKWLAHVQQPDLIPPPAADDVPVSNVAGPPRRRRFLISAAGGALFVLAGVLLFLQTNKGTLRIESAADDVIVRVMRGEKEYDRLNVTKKGEAILVGAGEYEIAIDGKHDGLTVKGGRVSVTRGETEVVKIVEEKDEALLGIVPTPDAIARHPEKLGLRPFERSPGVPAYRAKPLTEVVREFNESNSNSPIGKDQPPLTDDEIIASVRWNLREQVEKKVLSEEELRQFFEIVEKRILHSNWKLRALDGYKGQNNHTVQVWSIRLVLMRPEGQEFQHVIRHRWIGKLDELGRAIKEPPSDETENEDATPLAAAIHGFNSGRNSVDGQKQPPLTEEEVITAIRGFPREEAPVTNDEFAEFQRIADTRQFPKGVRFELLPEFLPGDGFHYYIWSVRIRAPQTAKPGWTFAYEIRKQFIRSFRIDDGNFAWGQPGANGLRVGVKFDPRNDVYLSGQKVSPTFFFQNTSGEMLPVNAPRMISGGHYKGMKALDSSGKPIALDYEKISWVVGAMGLTLPPKGECQIRGVPILLGDLDRGDEGAVIRAKPGQAVRVRFVVSNIADGGGPPLETGEIVFKMADTTAKQ